MRRKQVLEDKLFQRMHPEAYARVRRFVEQYGGARGEMLQSMVDEVTAHIGSRRNVIVESRVKHYFSIYRKHTCTGKSLSRIFDLLGIRMICETVPECYATVADLHQMYEPIGNRYKDYITHPKPNGYRSIHTTVTGPAGTPVECQIRTLAMHMSAEPTHADYKRKEQYHGTEKW